MSEPNSQIDIDALVATAKFNQSIQEQRAIERAKFTAATTVALNGGLFAITPTLLTHLRFIIMDAAHATGDDVTEISTVLIDTNGYPIRVDDCAATYAQWNAIWDRATKQYAITYAKLKTIRTVTGLIK